MGGARHGIEQSEKSAALKSAHKGRRIRILGRSESGRDPEMRSNCAVPLFRQGYQSSLKYTDIKKMRIYSLRSIDILYSILFLKSNTVHGASYQ